MAIWAPITYIENAISTLVDAIKVNVSGMPVTREVLAIGDDTDFSGTPTIARVNPANNGLYVSTPELVTLFESLISNGALKVSSSTGSSSGSSSSSSPGLLPTATIAVAAGAAAAAAASGAGSLFGIVVTASGSTPLRITDGPNGPTIAIVPANMPIGDVPLFGGFRPYATSLYVQSGSNTPAVTLVYGSTNTTGVGSTNASPVAASAPPAALKTGAGFVYGIVVTAVGASELTITDGPGGRIIAIVPPEAPLGDVPLYSPRPFITSPYVNSSPSTPAVTVVYA